MVQTAPDHFVACHVRAPAPPAPPLANEDSP
jgi:hypothetical protein